MRWILPAIVIVLPFGFLSFGSYNKGQLITLIILGLAVLAVKVKPLSLRLFCWYVAAWAVYRHAYKVYIDPYFAPNPLPSLEFALALAAVIIVYIAVTESDISDKWFFVFIGVMAIFQALLGLGQTEGYNPVFDFLASKANTKNELSGITATGTLGNQDFLLAYIVIVLPLFYRKWWRLAIPVFVYLLAISMVSTAVISALVGVVVYFGRGLKRFLYVTIPCMIGGIGYVFYIDRNFNTLFAEGQRGSMWLKALNKFETWPQILFGFGPGASWGGKGTLHNDWLSTFHTFGLIGLVLVGLFVWDTIKKVRHDRTMLAVIVTVIVNCLGNLPMQLAFSSTLILILFGLAQREVVNG